MLPRRCCVLGLCVSLPLLATRVGHADESRTRVGVSYSAPAACPGKSTFTDQLLRRTNRVEIATNEPDSRPVQIDITPTDTGFSGRLELGDGEGHMSHRDVNGASCDAVVSALALVTALALDPEASTAPLPPAASSSATASSPPPPPPVPPPRKPAKRPPVASLPLRRPPPTPAVRARPVPSWYIALGVDGAARAGVTPDLAGPVPVFVEMGWSHLGPLDPSLRVAFERSWSDATQVAGATATFHWTAGALELCPFEWKAGGLRAAPCLRTEAGVLEGKGSNIVPPRDQQRAWLAVGPVGRAQWAFLPPAFVDFGLGLEFPLFRERFYFEPDTPVYQAPAVGWRARLGVGLRFP